MAESAFADLAALAPCAIWDAVVARPVAGERVMLAVVELGPDAVVPEHRHEHEQLGLVLRGTVDFEVARERRTLGPGGTWCIRSQQPHTVTAGPEGAVVVDVFAPARADWAGLPRLEPRAPSWP